MYQDEDSFNVETLLTSLIPKDCKSRLKMYIAGPWFTDKSKAIMNFIDIVANDGKCVYDCYFPHKHQFNTPLETYNSNIYSIKACDIMLAFISEKDVGTAFEIGMAKGMNKPIIYLVYDINDFLKSKTNLMLAMNSTVITIDNLSEYLRGHEVDTYYTDGNSWEGIE